MEVFFLGDGAGNEPEPTKKPSGKKNRLALQHWALAHGYIRIVDVLLDVVNDEGVVGTVEDARVLLGRLQEGVVLATAPTQVGPGTSVLPAQKK